MLLVKQDQRLRHGTRPTLLLSQSLYHVLNYTDLKQLYDTRLINAAIGMLELKHVDARLKQHRIAEGIDRLFEVTHDHPNTSALVQDFRQRYLDPAIYKALVMLCNRLVSPKPSPEKQQSQRLARTWHMLDRGMDTACELYNTAIKASNEAAKHGK